MQKRRHHRTPGPWHLKKRGWMGGGPYVIGSAQRVVADCNLEDEEGTYRKVENMANAKFISKAPEMYILLEKAQALLEGSNLVLEREGEILDKEKWNEQYTKLVSKIRDFD